MGKKVENIKKIAGNKMGRLKLAICQYIKANSSICITDPSGEIHKATAEAAKKHGYELRIFDIRNGSDSLIVIE